MCPWIINFFCDKQRGVCQLTYESLEVKIRYKQKGGPSFVGHPFVYCLISTSSFMSISSPWGS